MPSRRITKPTLRISHKESRRWIYPLIYHRPFLWTRFVQTRLDWAALALASSDHRHLNGIIGYDGGHLATCFASSVSRNVWIKLSAKILNVGHCLCCGKYVNVGDADVVKHYRGSAPRNEVVVSVEVLLVVPHPRRLVKAQKEVLWCFIGSSYCGLDIC